MAVDPIETQRKTVLLVDDQASVRFVVARLLEKAGYRVLPAGSGAEALEIWETCSQEIDLLFTDLQMPGMTGPELVARLRELNPRLKVLFTSGSGIAVVESMLNSEERGHFLPKPFRSPELTAAVNEAINADS